MLKEFKLSELGKIVGGATPSTKIPEFFKGDIPWITPKDLADFPKRYISSGERSISKEALNSCSAQMLPKNSILFSSRAPIGYIAIAQNDLCTNQGFKSIVPNTNIVDPLFLFYLLKSSVNNIVKQASGTTFKEISGKTLGQIKVLMPESITEQQQIASLLGTIDDAIELNQAINDNLEAMARQLYEYWFVQFEFPDENGRPYKSSGGKMVWSDELNQYIPYGWKASQIKDFIASNVGGTWGNDICEYGDVKVSCIRGADIDSFKSFPTRFIKEKQLKLLLKPMDLVVEVSGGSPTQSTGRIAIITNELLNSYDDSVICSNFCRALTLKDNGYSSYFYYLWKLFYDQGVMFNFEGKTTGIKNLQTDVLFQTNVVKPNKDVASKFNQIIINIKSLQCNNINDNEFYINLRNSLNKELMTGQVTVNYHLSDD
ncbi:restriction endonuclease subunit S [Anaerobiospirillum sp. NML120448]|uniref:restriction endonuclease subunit S n=1 Tax=Anaerobiospirillum sp. NML120448 TaxID=2932816 RepID=UPI001FF3D9E5|nr:restriction endonuclease subunit S [Anaerobiospirillum sp. NML120448]MCK0513936.1 restriction endonuclease subunit S [Anaerobiospirillum sp. NML120448]